MSRRSVRQNRRAGAAPIASLPAPLTVPGLMAWYEADFGVTTVSGRVSAWADQSLAGDTNRTLIQGTAAFRPTFNAADANFNGHPSMTFSGADPDFLNPTGNWSVSIAQPITTFSVHSVSSLAAPVAYFDDQATTNGFSLQQSAGGGFFARAGALLSSGSDNTLNKPTVYAVVFNGNSSLLYDSAQTAVVTGAIGSNGSTGLVVGSSPGGGSALSGTMCALLVYSGALTGAQRSVLWGYLGAKYGVTIGA